MTMLSKISWLCSSALYTKLHCLRVLKYKLFLFSCIFEVCPTAQSLWFRLGWKVDMLSVKF